MRYFIERGADIHAPPAPKGGITALQCAAFNGRTKVVKFLLDFMVDINAAPSKDGGKTVLEACATSICCEDEECLLESDHEDPIKRAELFQLLLDHGASINRPKEQTKYRNWKSVLTCLIKAFAGESWIRCALKAGADVNELGHGPRARTSLQAAAELQDTNLIQMLIENGANVNAPAGGYGGRTALQAICSLRSPNADLVKLLLENGANVNAPAACKQGLTALQGAAIQGNLKIALMLVDAGADVNAEAAVEEGRTALDGAAEHGRLDMVQMLLNLGAKSENPGETGVENAVKLARRNNHFALAKFLEEQALQV
ncbi:ankyrin repeat-containing domain protein, partial [Halenospora varia]